jgi:cellulose synthase/poly-beta-1,6-N-acetylglucosamine synthase-like glycosyltransferase
MCFSTHVLRKHPWSAFSVAEDLEYGLDLLIRGVTTKFAPGARVLATMPRDAKNAESQRARWEGGRFGIIRRFARPLLKSAFSRFSFVPIDAFVELITPALMNMMGLVLFGLFATCILLLAGVQGMMFFAAGWSVCLFLGLFHLFGGLAVARADKKLYLALLQIPRYGLWKILVYVKMAGKWDSRKWVRTAREKS